MASPIYSKSVRSDYLFRCETKFHRFVRIKYHVPLIFVFTRVFFYFISFFLIQFLFIDNDNILENFFTVLHCLYFPHNSLSPLIDQYLYFFFFLSFFFFLLFFSFLFFYLVHHLHIGLKSFLFISHIYLKRITSPNSTLNSKRSHLNFSQLTCILLFLIYHFLISLKKKRVEKRKSFFFYALISILDSITVICPSSSVLSKRSWKAASSRSGSYATVRCRTTNSRTSSFSSVCLWRKRACVSRSAASARSRAAHSVRTRCARTILASATTCSRTSAKRCGFFPLLTLDWLAHERTCGAHLLACLLVYLKR